MGFIPPDFTQGQGGIGDFVPKNRQSMLYLEYKDGVRMRNRPSMEGQMWATVNCSPASPVITSLLYANRAVLTRSRCFPGQKLAFNSDNMLWHQGIKAENASVLVLAALTDRPSIESQKETLANKQIIEFFSGHLKYRNLPRVHKANRSVSFLCCALCEEVSWMEKGGSNPKSSIILAHFSTSLLVNAPRCG